MGRHGNVQLLRRSMVQAFGIPIHLFRGVGKIVILTGTPYQRQPVEIAVNFLRCFVILGVSWSLYRQWITSGTGLPPPQEQPLVDDSRPESAAVSTELAVSSREAQTTTVANGCHSVEV